MSFELKCTKSDPIVETKYGRLRGFFYDGVYNFWGVRYAVAKRFHMPEEQESWEGVRDALAYGYVSPLLEDPIPNNEITVPHRYWPMGEDCLNLNIFTPTIDPEAKKPVMVWFHGGGFSDGSAIAHIAFEGDNMARYHDVVMICVNHRLNAFGFFDMTMFGEEYKNSVNAGMVDLQASLQWIRENIKNFGGDPDNVTIFGQSGGGGKVTTLGQAPEADGLFHKAIIMSGVFSHKRPRGDAFPEADHKAFVLEVLRQLNLTEKDYKKLETVHFRLFILAVNRAIRVFGRKGQVIGWHPTKNFWYLGEPMMDGFTEHFKTIPTMVGSTLGEFFQTSTQENKMTMSEEEQKQVVYDKYGKEKGERLIELFKEAYPGKNVAFADSVDNMVRDGSKNYCKKKSEGEHAPVYSYLLSSVYDFDNGMTAWHNCDIPYAFANGDRIQYCHATENAEALCRYIPAVFSAFAHTGDPNVEGLPHWDPATPEHVPTMIFDKEIEVKTDHDDALIAYIDEIAPPFSLGHHFPKTDDDVEGTIWMY